ncbi:MAG TPA: hypothetical protein VLN72_02965, partial [Gillisia sp.]|nr:hypothetical protein [Gillisia sp.]
MNKAVSFILFFIIMGVGAQTPKKTNNTTTETKKANFRVQVFEKKTEADIKLEEADPEFKKRLPISAKIEKTDITSLKDLPRAKVIDSVWKSELLNSDLYDKMQKE